MRKNGDRRVCPPRTGGFRSTSFVWGQTRLSPFFLLTTLFSACAFAQVIDEDFHVYNDPPRLLLTRQRLRLLQRERERTSMRWEQFNYLITKGAPMPEPGFANALHYRVSNDPASARKAVEWALADANTDLRQLALVFDWCGPAMSKAQSDRLGAKIEKALAAAPSGTRAQSARALATIAIADRLPDHGEAILKTMIESWWRKQVVPTLDTAKPLIAREDTYALYELLHAIEDNLKIDLRESAGEFFKDFPIDHLAGHYPAAYPGEDNEFRIPVFLREGEPDLKEAAMSRAAELAMVAFDTNAQDSQYLQGWLLQDRFLMRGTLGIPYEFLWANPYQPGLSYFHVPLVFHNGNTGHLFARTSWDEDATWIGFFDGRMQMFRDGQVQTLKPGVSSPPIEIGGAVLMSAPAGPEMRVRLASEVLFMLGLEPRAAYEVELEDQEMDEVATDAGGTLVLSSAPGVEADARVRRRAEQRK